MTALIIFVVSYIGIGLGKLPGLAMDRTGIALLGAIAMIVFGVITPESAFNAIDLPTILLLYSLMIISAQFRLGGFYTWAAKKNHFSGRQAKDFFIADHARQCHFFRFAGQRHCLFRLYSDYCCSSS